MNNIRETRHTLQTGFFSRKTKTQISGEYKPLWEIAYNTIRHNILIGVFEADTPLVVSKLSEEMGMSVIPIREAMRHLENEGLVYVVPHKGVTVARYDLEDIKEIYEVRKILESHAMFLATPNITQDVLLLLKESMRKIEESLTADDFEGYAAANNCFHQTLYGCSGNFWLCKMINDLWVRTNRSMAAMKWSREHSKRMIDDHENIIKALENHETPEFMQSFIAQHVEAAKQGVVKYVEGISG
jgi:DNA-binding GntR family transcriptional regulator